MCGIVGEIRFDESIVDSKNINKMMDAIRHRGPDDSGEYIDGSVGLGFVRLSIIDLSSAGHQPMVSEDGKYVLIFNGEIYNYIELREELKELGYSFKSKTDSEVLLKSYIAWGKECLHKFNGMWAFVIYNRETKEIFGARDRFGIKPFYYYKDNSRLLFASEIKAFKSVLGRLDINKRAIFNYLVFNRTDYDNTTFYKDIFKLPHGSCFSINNGEFKIERWYNLKERCNKEPIDANEYLNLLTTSINLRLRSDVPVGVCLSGGLDSSTIASIIVKRLNHKDINSFSAVYQKGQIGDESEYIDQMKSYIKNMRFITPTAKSLYEDLHDLISALDEPVPTTSIYAQYCVMKLAKEYAVVTLDGQGADEQLAGYHYFYGFYFKEILKELYLVRLFREIYYYLKRHKSLYGIKTMLFFMLPNSLKTKLRAKVASYIKEDFYNKYSKNNVIVDELYSSKSLKEALINHFEYKLEHLLKWSDLNSMRFSIESRVPFLDYRVVEQTLSLPSENYIKYGLTKYILREAIKGIVPEKIRLRYDKTGFETPQDEWFREDFFKEFIWNILNNPHPLFEEFIDIDSAKLIYKRHLNKEINASKDIWKWINLSVWLEKEGY